MSLMERHNQKHATQSAFLSVCKILSYVLPRIFAHVCVGGLLALFFEDLAFCLLSAS